MLYVTQRIKEEEDERNKMRREMKQDEEERLQAMNQSTQNEMQHAKDQIKVGKYRCTF